MKPTAQKRKSMPAGSHAFRIHDLLKKRKEDLAVKDGNIAASIAAASASAVAAALVAPSSSSSSSSSFQAVEVIEDDSEKALPRAIRQVAAAAPLLGAATLDPVDAIGKQEFGFEAGDVLKLKYIDPKPLQGFKQFLNEIFTCKV